ncbi:MAG: pyrrolidone-carboxylate peptidase [Paenibacillus sp.]|uniref:pyroglutamyl-peptidase I n=1 Tax=Paenibacillus sp. GCM10012303 TaxID=3317340 RepID=UPI0029ED1992|nr:pyrrolidone-carboxylate peptidase [Paenibacillus sp.]
MPLRPAALAQPLDIQVAGDHNKIRLEADVTHLLDVKEESDGADKDGGEPCKKTVLLTDCRAIRTIRTISVAPKMKKILVTGFVPFLHYPINPTEQLAQRIDGERIGEYEVISAVLPVEFASSAAALLRKYEEVSPDAVISLGLAAGRDRITPERIAINCSDGDADNSGVVCRDQTIAEDGPAAYFTTLPYRAMINRLLEHGIPAQISNSAGTYLCNNVMYQMLHRLHQENRQDQVRSGFIHIPASHELALLMKRSVPSFALETLHKALRLMILELSAQSRE